MKTISYFKIFYVSFCICMVFQVAGSTAWADSTVMRVVVTNSSGEKNIAAAMVLDKVSALAGLKIVFSYNEKDFTFKTFDKDRNTSSLLNVVNDKVPGRVVVVMAGAKGISGENMKLFTLSFSPKAADYVPENLELRADSVEMLTDTLQKIDCVVEYGE